MLKYGVELVCNVNHNHFWGNPLATSGGFWYFPMFSGVALTHYWNPLHLKVNIKKLWRLLGKRKKGGNDYKNVNINLLTQLTETVSSLALF
jgi:hypothetical protein